MKRIIVCMICVLGILMSPCHDAVAKAPLKPARPCVTQIHVMKGCPTCEAMEKWLRKAGFELDVTSVEQGHYKLYPTVVYSDRQADHGERMYKQEAGIPAKICVISCSFGTE